MEITHYQRLYTQLKSQIQSGHYKEGDLLPSENELGSQHRIARMTVRRALTELANEGYIRKVKGKGSIVSATRKSLGLLSFKGFSEVVGAEHQVKTMTLRAPTVMAWPDRFFYALSQEEQQAGCVTLERVRFVNDEPIMIEYTYLPQMGLIDFCESPFVDGSLFKTLSLNYQTEITNIEQDIRAVTADEVTAFLLKVKPLTPLVQLYRRYHTSRPDYYVYSHLYCNTEQYTISNFQ
ncbi:GntR family transcriptional regulator [Telluribacter sp.]|jgi:GntR family transcriptional regulator/GntR family frlABCD operon transcriptional regulator|uniref:GntR family transcriptional regulator n=1 Tax=Telluribacter sp. TaxID=1978767 RepID=UPI002E1293D8|nr:GntR family transcriptional regulator [Telluribacter sp.]